MGVVKVETFDVDVSADGQTHTLSNAVDLNYAFVRNVTNYGASPGPIGNTGNAGPDDCSAAGYLTGPTTVTFAANAINKKMIGEVWRYTGAPGGVDEFVVRGRFQVTVPGGQGSASVAVPGIVDRNKCVAFITGKVSTLTANNTFNQFMAIAFIDASGNLVVERNNTGGSALDVYVTVVEFTGSNWTVAYARASFANQNASLYLDSEGTSGALANLNWPNALIAQRAMSGDTGGNVAIEDLSVTSQPGGVDSVLIEKDPTAASNGSVFIQVIQHPGMFVGRATAARNIPNNNTYFTETFPGSVSLAALDEAAIEWTVFSDGGGTALARGALSARLTGISTIESWVHRSGNNANYGYGVADLSGILGVVVPAIADAPGQISQGALNVTLTGTDFGAVQGAGRVEVWSDTAGTIKVVQTVDSWSDTAIQFDFVDTGLTEGQRYIVVVDDAGTNSPVWPFLLGLLNYSDLISTLNPDHWWQLNNDGYADSAGANPMTSSVSGDGGSFEAFPICEFNTHSWLADNNVRRGPANTVLMNDAETTDRTMCGWLVVNQITQPLTCIYKEGGNVNNISLFLGMGNVVIASFADSGDDNVQAYGDFKLKPGRPYHITFRFSYNEFIKEFRLYIDGEEQAVTSGNPLLSNHLDGHPGNIIFGGAGASLEVGGTDVSFGDQESSYYAQWASWTVPLHKTNDIRDKLFRRGALPDLVIASDTAANMQIALDAISGTLRRDWPLAIRVEEPSDGQSLALSADNITFDPGCTIQVEWRGRGELTWTNLNGANGNASRFVATEGSGIVVVVNPAVLTLTGLQTGTEVRVYEAGTSTEINGVEDSGTTFQTNVQVGSVDIVIHALGYIPIRLTGVDMSGGNVSLPIQQRIDRYYFNPVSGGPTGAVVASHTADSVVPGVTYNGMTGTSYLFTTTGLNSTAMTFSQGGDIHYLIVGGGGAGGRGAISGGGGAGALRESSVAVTTASPLQATVGQGGTSRVRNDWGASDNGDASQIDGAGLASPIVADGGSGGGYYSGTSGVAASPVYSGNGSGGGGATGWSSGGVVGSDGGAFGNDGGDGGADDEGGGGGGGAGGPGVTPNNTTFPMMDGGIGVQSDITGTPTWYAGGGGGAADNLYVNGGTGTVDSSEIGGVGGLGGGGNGGRTWDGTNTQEATPGAANTGGGGGADPANNTADDGMDGGSGIVVIFVED